MIKDNLKLTEMKRLAIFFEIFSLTLIFLSCSSTQYIYDSSSFHRQKELKSNRSASVFGEIFLITASALTSATFDTEIEYQPSLQNFKQIRVTNPTTDTLYVNMLTDCSWDSIKYCDFMDIRVPPLKTCRILCPLHAEYNVYYSNTPQNDDDEMITINTDNISKLKLKPDTHLTSESK